MFHQMSHYMDNVLSKHQWVSKMLEKWKSAADKRKSFGALLTDLSEAFDCLLHHLLL